MPAVGVLDPDGDIVRYLAASGTSRRPAAAGDGAWWACHHTDMWVTDLDAVEVGVVDMAVGARFAVLVAEQLDASGAEMVVSVSSAGQITPIGTTPCSC